MTLIVGHRGARNLWPENSIGGFNNLLGLPVDGVEFDVHLTDAGELLVIHDPTLERTTTGAGPVRALPPRRKVTLTGTTEPIPTLDEVLAIFAKTGHELHIELKQDAAGRSYDGMAAAIIGKVGEHGLAQRSVLTSFDPEELANIRRLSAGSRTLLSLDRRSAGALEPRAALERAAAAADLVAVQMSYLDEHWELATDVLPLDRLGVWVPNTEADLDYWAGRGLRQLTTDRPDLALKARQT